MDKPVSYSSVSVPVRRVPGGPGAADKSSDSDRVAVEEPLEIKLAYTADGERAIRTVAITMRTPGDDINLVLGFLFTEGLIHSHADVLSVEFCDVAGEERAQPNSLLVDLRPDMQVDLQSLDRHFYTTSSCGVCGKTSLEAIRAQAKFAVGGERIRLTEDMLNALPALMAQHQNIFAGTGSVHAAALFDEQGALHHVFEDVGRHNALDKVIGARFAAQELPLHEQGLLVSGRASFELVQKARMAGCPVLVAVGAPSSLAIELAWEFDMTLIGFLRDGRFNVYSGPARVA
jgi:FdhD protein